MPLKVSCMKCGGVLHAPDDAGGKKGKCPNCGNILPIPMDSPKVTDSLGGGTGGLPDLPATTAVGNPVPRPTEPRGFGSATSLPAKPISESKPFGGASGSPASPFAADAPRQPPTARPAPAPSPTYSAPSIPAGGKGWARARRGLWWVRTGVLFHFLAGLVTVGLAATTAFDLHLEQKDPLLLQIPRITLLSELQLVLGFVPYALGFLAIVLGLAGVANVPSSSGAKGTARWASLFGCLALAGFVTAGMFVGGQIATGVTPDWSPSQDLATGVRVQNKQRVELNTQERIAGYGRQVLLESHELSGAATRFGLLAFALFGVYSQCWFLGAVGRIGAHLQDRATCFRTTLLGWFCSLSVALAAFVWLAVALLGRFELKFLLDKWEGYSAETRTGVIAGVAGGAAFLGFVLYVRMLNAARRAVSARIGS